MANEHSSPLVGRAQLAGLAGQQFGGDRDLYEVLGYNRVLTPQDYTDAYERGDIAGRIVDAYPDATWGEQPSINAPGDSVEEIKGLSDLNKAHKFWRTLHRLDRLTNLGHYGVLVLGLDGGEPMYTPAEGNDYSLLYMQPHSERTAQVLRWESDPASPRYGKPVLYGIEAGTNWTGVGAGRVHNKVHHSRVIHVAERTLEDQSIGTPRLKRIFNRLFDLDKLLGGGAEIFWKNAAMYLHFNADANVDYDEETIKRMQSSIEEMMHGLNRNIRTQGVDAQQLAPGMQGQGPGELIDKELDFIAGATGIPKRILVGSERGELASTQDETAWSNRIMERREQHAGPNMLAPTLDRLMQLGCLDKQAYEIEWPDDDTLGEEKRAQIGKTRMEALSAYNSNPSNELVVSPDEAREVLGYEGPLPTVPDEPPVDEDDADVADQFNQQMQRIK